MMAWRLERWVTLCTIVHMKVLLKAHDGMGLLPPAIQMLPGMHCDCSRETTRFKIRPALPSDTSAYTAHRSPGMGMYAAMCCRQPSPILIQCVS